MTHKGIYDCSWDLLGLWFCVMATPFLFSHCDQASMLWRKRVTAIASEYPGIELSHMYVDNAAMQLVRDPKQVYHLIWSFFLTVIHPCQTCLRDYLLVRPLTSNIFCSLTQLSQTTYLVISYQMKHQ